MNRLITIIVAATLTAGMCLSAKGRTASDDVDVTALYASGTPKPDKLTTKKNVALGKYLQQHPDEKLMKDVVKQLTKNYAKLRILDYLWLKDYLEGHGQAKEAAKLTKEYEELKMCPAECVELIRYYDSKGDRAKAEHFFNYGYTKLAAATINKKDQDLDYEADYPWMVSMETVDGFLPYIEKFRTKQDAVDFVSNLYSTSGSYFDGSACSKFFADNVSKDDLKKLLLAQVQAELDAYGKQEDVMGHDVTGEFFCRRHTFDQLIAIQVATKDVNRSTFSEKDQKILDDIDKFLSGAIYTDDFRGLYQAFYDSRALYGDDVAIGLISNYKLSDNMTFASALTPLKELGDSNPEALIWMLPYLYNESTKNAWLDGVDELAIATGSKKAEEMIGEFKVIPFRGSYRAIYEGTSPTVTIKPVLSKDGKDYNIISAHVIKNDAIVTLNVDGYIKWVKADACPNLTTVNFVKGQTPMETTLSNNPNLVAMNNFEFVKEPNEVVSAVKIFLEVCDQSPKMVPQLIKQIEANCTQFWQVSLSYNYLLPDKYWNDFCYKDDVLVTKYVGETLLRNAANKGDADAMLDYCNAFLKDYINNSANYFKFAKALLAKRPALGNYFLGVAYEYGYGVKANRATALSYYRAGSALGDKDCDRAYFRLL